MGGPLAFDGRHLMRGHINQIKVGVDVGGGDWREEATTDERVGGVLSLRAGRRIEDE